MKRLLVISLFLSGCAAVELDDEWRPRDTTLEVRFQVLNAIDAWTTQRIRERPDLEEVEPITRAVLGARPKPGETAVYFAALGVTHYLVSRALPTAWRRSWQSVTIAYSASMVDRNCNLGLCDGRKQALTDQLGEPIICVGSFC